MLRISFLALVTWAVIASDIGRVYPPGTEPAKGNQDLCKQYPAGKELAHLGNQHLAHNYGDLSK